MAELSGPVPVGTDEGTVILQEIPIEKEVSILKQTFVQLDVAKDVMLHLSGIKIICAQCSRYRGCVRERDRSKRISSWRVA